VVAQPLFRIASGGGAPVAVTALSEGEVAHKFPQFLPDGHRFLYLRASADRAKAGVYVGDIDRTPAEQSRERILATNRQAYFAASPDGGRGHLIYLSDTTLMAQPFDPDRLELSGDAVPIAEKVDSFPAQFYGLFSVSNNGTLVYREGLGSTLALTWFDQNGKPAGVFGEPGDYANPVMSPDQSRIAVARGPAGARDIWIVDIARGSSTRLTFDSANDDNPVWSPDSTDIVFSSDRSGVRRMYLKPSDGSGDERLLTDQLGLPSSWSKDGRFLLFTSVGPTTGGDLWALPDPRRVSGNGKPFVVLQTSFAEANARFSPDGRWIAYTSNESSASDVYVRAFSPDGTAGPAGAKWLISRPGLNGAVHWHPDGKRLLYANGTTFDLMAVDIDTSKGFQAGTPRPLFRAAAPFLSVNWSFGPDAQRYIFVTTPDGSKPTPFTVVLDWAAALRK
jgi:Tol biopolymer transport system component